MGCIRVWCMGLYGCMAGSRDTVAAGQCASDVSLYLGVLTAQYSETHTMRDTKYIPIHPDTSQYIPIQNTSRCRASTEGDPAVLDTGHQGVDLFGFRDQYFGQHGWTKHFLLCNLPACFLRPQQNSDAHFKGLRFLPFMFVICSCTFRPRCNLLRDFCDAVFSAFVWCGVALEEFVI